MRKQNYLWVFSLLAAVVYAEEPVHFHDGHLKVAVEDTLWIVDPTPTDMLGLTELACIRAEIENLAGLEYAQNLQVLFLRGNRIRDLSALANLDSLRKINLSKNEIQDLGPLAGLVNLVDLDVHANSIEDLSPLAGLVNLERLIIRLNQIEDISPLSGLVRLEELVLRHNRIQDISALGGLTLLRDLTINNNLIDDISILSGLEDLRTVWLNHNRIDDLAALGGLLHLHTVYLHDNEIRDISPLGELTGLNVLTLYNNPLDEDACTTWIPRIAENNPFVSFRHDLCFPCYLELSSSPGGRIIDPGEGSFVYEKGSMINLTVQTLPGFVFDGFSGSYASEEGSVYIFMNQDHHIEARFKSLSHSIIVDDDAVNDPRHGDLTVSDPFENGSAAHPFDSIQEAILVAQSGAHIHVRPGTYHEHLTMTNSAVSLIGLDPNSTEIDEMPVIRAVDSSPVVRFSQDPSAASMLRGFVITAGRQAISCENSEAAVEYCLIAGHHQTGGDGAVIDCINSRAVFLNCTIADNDPGPFGAALFLRDSDAVIKNSILWNNGPNDILVTGDADLIISYTRIASDVSSITTPGAGMITGDPMFAAPGFWDESFLIWNLGDYHLRSTSGYWNREVMGWIADDTTSICIDAGDPNSPLLQESEPNGGLINLGVYGGTTQASRSDPL